MGGKRWIERRFCVRDGGEVGNGWSRTGLQMTKGRVVRA